MKRTIITTLWLVAMLLGGGAEAWAQQPSVCQWAASRAWANGYDGAKPDKTVNFEEFYSQYHRDPNQWHALFQWLKTTDLKALPKGKHPIPNSTLVASVEDAENGPVERRQTESHRKKIDFQLVVSGTEGFALLDHASSTVSKPYDERRDVVRYDYDRSKTNFFSVSGGNFVIFFPSDWHIAKVLTKKKDQTLRVVVVKMDYIDE